MKAERILLTLVFGAAALAQSNSTSVADGRYFNLVDVALHREDLTEAELGVLADNDLMRTKLTAIGSKLTQEGLESAVVHLCGADERDLIVIGNGSAYATEYAGPFWIIRDLAAGPVIVLSETSLSLSIDTKRSNKCLNVQSFAVTATDGITTDYKFDGQNYIQSKQKSVKLRQ